MPSSFSSASPNDRAPLDNEDAREILARRVPKAELHMHHVGSQPPSEYARLAGIPRENLLLHAAPSPRSTREAYDNLGTAKFFDDLDRAVGRWSDAPALVTGVVRMVSDAFDHGVRHLELLCTPTLSQQQTGMPVRSVLAAIGEGFQIAASTLGVSGGIVIDIHRFDGPDAALELVRDTVDLRELGVPILGYGSDGDHRTVALRDLAPAFDLARSEGFRLTAHADTLEDVRVALDLGLDRIDHGWLAATDDDVLARLVAAGTPLTFCPMAYVITRRPSPLRWDSALAILRDAGVPIALGTDDPALHHTDLAHSYDLVARRLGWSASELADAARVSFAAAWITEPERTTALADWNSEIDDLLTDPRGAFGSAG